MTGEQFPEVSEDQVKAYDPALELALRLFPASGWAFGLTVLIGGERVTGVAISREAWEEAWIEQISGTGVGDELVQLLASRLSEARAQFNDWMSQLAATDSPQPRDEFLYMRDVRFLSDPNTEFPLWRFRLSDVSGWTMGEWKPAPGS